MIEWIQGLGWPGAWGALCIASFAAGIFPLKNLDTKDGPSSALLFISMICGFLALFGQAIFP